MSQSNFVHAGQFQSDHIIIGGKILELDNILNKAFLVPKKIRELSEIFKHPHLVFEGLFSPILLELMHEDFDFEKR